MKTLECILGAHDLREALRIATEGHVVLDVPGSKEVIYLLRYGTDGGNWFDDFKVYVAGSTDLDLAESAADDLIEAVLHAFDGSVRVSEADAATVAALLANRAEGQPRLQFEDFRTWLSGDRNRRPLEHRIRDAAVRHADRLYPEHSELHRIIPNGKYPASNIVEAVEALTGRPFDASGVGAANARLQIPARLRAHLSRWVRLNSELGVPR